MKRDAFLAAIRHHRLSAHNVTAASLHALLNNHTDFLCFEVNPTKDRVIRLSSGWFEVPQQWWQGRKTASVAFCLLDTASNPVRLGLALRWPSDADLVAFMLSAETMGVVPRALETP